MEEHRKLWAVERRYNTLTTENGTAVASVETARLGTVVQREDGFRFISNVSSRGNSRKFHPTFEACLPRWVGYPNNCETRVITPVFGPEV